MTSKFAKKFIEGFEANILKAIYYFYDKPSTQQEKEMFKGVIYSLFYITDTHTHTHINFF